LESEWGRNVVKYGLVGMGISRCAPLHGSPLGILTNLRVPGSPYALIADLPLHPAIDNYDFGVAFVPSTHPHFPYGYAVD
jgi:hypothetical protein